MPKMLTNLIIEPKEKKTLGIPDLAIRIFHLKTFGFKFSVSEFHHLNLSSLKKKKIYAVGIVGNI